MLAGATAFSSYYHSLNVRLQKRLTHGMTIISNFIWSSSIDHTSYLNDTDPAPEKRIGLLSRPFHEVLAMSYDLPFGRGKRFAIGNRIRRTAWRAAGPSTACCRSRAVAPIAWGNVIYYGGPLNLQNHQPDGLAFDVTQFNRVSAQQLADNIRTFSTQFNNLRADPTKNLDLSVLKKFMIHEQTYLQIRFETFNTTNRVAFGAPNVTPTNSTFGQITTQANTPRRLQVGARLVW